jgi:CheY-like chemotaxis protein/MinD-like ATPase involved in chromosome partitioning or flagellar assembly
MHKILIVDDDACCQEVLSDALESERYELCKADDGHAALKMIEESPPDLVLLDIEMPRMNGVEALKRLKADEKTRDIPVIMVTALNTDTQIATCLDNGAVDHVVKPFSNMVVRARVRAALRSYDAFQSTDANATNRGKVFAFIGSKGGVGTTTAVLNVAMDLVKKGKSTIVCELRPDFGTAAVQLGVSAERNLSTLLESNSGKITKEALEECLCKHPTGLRALLAPQGSDGFVDVSPEQAEAIVTGMAEMADYAIVDLPCSPYPSTDAVLRRSDFVVLIVERETASLMAAQQTLERLRAQGIGGNSVGVIVNNRAIVSSPIELSEVRTSLDCLLIGVIPPDPDACMLASKTHAPVILARSNSGPAGAFASVAYRLTQDQVGVLQF